MQAKFIVIEGLEGAGKSTAVSTVIEWLAEQGISDVITTREPGGTPLAEKMRAIFKEDSKDDPLTDPAELMLIYAARSQLVENVIKPALVKGQWVVGDRHDLSTLAYQGGGRGFDLDTLTTLKQITIGAFKPDLTLLLDIAPEQGLQRAKKRGELDRIEVQEMSFFKRVDQVYQDYTASDESIIAVDAGQELANVKAQIRATLAQQLQISSDNN